jgi:hypothetical protein
MVEDLNILVEYCQNYFLSKDLKQYRPHRRPITNYDNTKPLSKEFKRKKRLVVRDWFFYVVWYVRLKRILTHMYSTDVLEHELQNQLSQSSNFAKLLQILEDPKANIRDLTKEMSPDKKVKDIEPNVIILKLQKAFSIRMEDVQLNVYSQPLYEAPHP